MTSARQFLGRVVRNPGPIERLADMQEPAVRMSPGIALALLGVQPEGPSLAWLLEGEPLDVAAALLAVIVTGTPTAATVAADVGRNRRGMAGRIGDAVRLRLQRGLVIGAVG